MRIIKTTLALILGVVGFIVLITFAMRQVEKNKLEKFYAGKNCKQIINYECKL